MKVNNELVIKASRGDKAAFSELYYSCYNELYKFALFTLGNPEDAADVVSDTFVDVWKNINNLRNPESFSPWVFRILSIRCKKEISKMIKRRGDLDFDEFIEIPAFGSENIEMNMAENVTLKNALMNLEKEERMILVLSVLYGYTHSEIGKIIGKPIGTVGSKLYRTYDKLRKQIGKR